MGRKRKCSDPWLYLYAWHGNWAWVKTATGHLLEKMWQERWGEICRACHRLVKEKCEGHEGVAQNPWRSSWNRQKRYSKKRKKWPKNEVHIERQQVCHYWEVREKILLQDSVQQWKTCVTVHDKKKAMKKSMGMACQTSPYTLSTISIIKYIQPNIINIILSSQILQPISHNTITYIFINNFHTHKYNPISSTSIYHHISQSKYITTQSHIFLPTIL